MNVTNTHPNTGVINDLQAPPPAPKTLPHALIKAGEAGRTAHRNAADNINVEDKANILTSGGLKLLLGKPTAKSNLKDAMVRMLVCLA